MDIDATRKAAAMPDLCHRCGKPGHFKRDCPQRYDIRFMSLEEKEDWMQEWALQADVAELQEKQEETGVEEKDFPARSG